MYHDKGHRLWMPDVRGIDCIPLQGKGVVHMIFQICRAVLVISTLDFQEIASWHATVALPRDVGEVDLLPKSWDICGLFVSIRTYKSREKTKRSWDGR